jgi:hypothetical protein
MDSGFTPNRQVTHRTGNRDRGKMASDAEVSVPQTRTPVFAKARSTELAQRMDIIL